jgi:ribosomal protein S18 acetylase RimI-like enzyme
MAVTLRPAQPDDEALLFTLYAASRSDEMAAWGWNEAQQEAFVRLQFNGRQQHYKTQFPDADHRIILLDDEPIGGMVVVRLDTAFRLADIVLLPPYRGRGYGAALIRGLLDEAKQAGKPVQLFVERFNPAIRLYERLGFSIIGDIGTHLSMEWRAGEP